MIYDVLNAKKTLLFSVIYEIFEGIGRRIQLEILMTIIYSLLVAYLTTLISSYQKKLKKT